MKILKVSNAKYKVFQTMSRKDLSALKKHPAIIGKGRALLKACKKVIKQVEAIPQYANHRKRQTAYKRIIKVCQKAIDLAENPGKEK
jgi:hypothetical protein